MFKTIRLRRRYPHAPEKVWAALTDPVALADWLMPNNFQPIRGHKFVFQVDPMGPMAGPIDCEVLEIDPPRRLVYSWQVQLKSGRHIGRKPTVVSWTLTPDGEGTILQFEHNGLDAMPFLFRFMLRFGWGTMVKRWIPKVAGTITPGQKYQPGVLGSTRMRYRATTVPDTLVKLP